MSFLPFQISAGVSRVRSVAQRILFSSAPRARSADHRPPKRVAAGPAASGPRSRRCSKRTLRFRNLNILAQTTPGLAAPITSSIVSSPYGTFTIGAGSADGVAQGSLVLTADGFVIGKVTQVQAHQSLVDEVFASGAQTPVSIDGSAVVATGQGGEAQAEVPHGITVSQNDPVTAPEYGGRPIGIVQHVDSNPANAQQAVYIALPVSLASLQFVYVTS